jgi:hypothetical protein
MKRFTILCIINALAILCYGQVRTAQLTASLGGVDRITLIKNSVEINPWHEATFWPMYEKYVTSIEEISHATTNSLNHVTGIEVTTPADEAVEITRDLLKKRNDWLSLLKSNYQEMANSFNGVIALDVLQNEVVLELMELAAHYDNTAWKKYRFHLTGVSNQQYVRAKKNTIIKALKLSKEETDLFWPLYQEYEAECERQLGFNYDMIALFSVEPKDFTPALAKRMGHDFLNVLEREQKLKEQYFIIATERVGANLASRFLVWEDYFSTVAKMHAWVEAP